MLKRETFQIGQIYVPVKRRGAFKPEVVREIAESMLDIGQQTPILVRPDGGRYVLVEGLHRLEACKALGEDTIDGFVVSAHTDGDKVKSPRDTEMDAVRQKTERLRRLRLSKEATDRATARIESPSTPDSGRGKPSRNKGGTRRSKPPSLVEWLAEQEHSGHRK